MTTCCSWTRSPSTGGRSPAQVEPEHHAMARAARAAPAATASLDDVVERRAAWPGRPCATGRAAGASPRSPAGRRRSCARRRCAPRRARGSARPSQRRQASPLVTTAASGWLTSCAIEAVSSPSVVDARRHARARPARALQRLLGRALRSVMSLLVSRIATGRPRSSRCSDQRLATVDLAAVARRCGPARPPSARCAASSAMIVRRAARETRSAAARA